MCTFRTCFMNQPAGQYSYCQSKARYSWSIFQKISPYKQMGHTIEVSILASCTVFLIYCAYKTPMLFPFWSKVRRHVEAFSSDSPFSKCDGFCLQYSEVLCPSFHTESNFLGTSNGHCLCKLRPSAGLACRLLRLLTGLVLGLGLEQGFQILWSFVISCDFPYS